MESNLPSCSIIIPSLNSPFIDQIITIIKAQFNKQIIGQIFVVGKDDLHLVNEDRIVKLIDTIVPVNSARARNIGIQIAQADILVFLDSDCLPDDHWLEAHISAHSEGHQIVCGGVIPDGDNYWSKSYNLTMFHEFFSTSAPGEKQFFPTLNVSINRTVIEQIGLLNENLTRVHDVEWSGRMHRAGFAIHFCPNAKIYHRHNRKSIATVWQDCAKSGYYSRQIRLNQTQGRIHFWLRHRLVILLSAPLVALLITLKIIGKSLSVMLTNWHVIPAIYITKIAWCWGASRKKI